MKQLAYVLLIVVGLLVFYLTDPSNGLGGAIGGGLMGLGVGSLLFFN